MATSPTPSFESLPGGNSIGSFGEPADYLSDSPLTLSGSSPPVSDSAICDDFSSGLVSSLDSQSSGSNSSNGPRCTGCKSKQSDAVAKCIECANYLCANCVTAHQFMHCFEGHSVFRINETNGQPNTLSKLMNTFETNRLSVNLKDDQTIVSKLSMTTSNGSSSGVSSITDRSVIAPPQGSTMPASTPSSSSSSSSMNVNGLDNSMAITTTTASTAVLSGSANSIIGNNNKLTNGNGSTYHCLRHKNELIKFYCRTCNVSVCKDCMINEHPAGLHECEHINEVTPKQVENLLQIVNEVRSKAADMRAIIKSAENISARIQGQYTKAQNEITDTYQFYRSMLDERKTELLKELENVYNAKNLSHTVSTSKSQDQVEKILRDCDLVERFAKNGGIQEAITLRRLMESKLQSFLSNIQDLQTSFELDFVSNYQAIQVGVRNTFGYIRSTPELPSKQQPPIARPTSNILTNGNSPSNSMINLHVQSQQQQQQQQQHQQQQQQQVQLQQKSQQVLQQSAQLLNGCQQQQQNGNNSLMDRAFANASGSIIGASQSQQMIGSGFDSNIISKRFNGANSLGPFIHSFGETNVTENPYEKWSNGGSENIINLIADQYQMPLNNCGNGVNQNDALLDLTSKLMTTPMFPPKSQIKRQKMIYHCKFGEFGVTEGQFTEPSGVAVNAQNDIIVADTNNHRIQIFDKEGRFKFQFGECGKRDGQLLYPNRVAVVRTSGDIIVTERSPTHQIQIYNQYGQFVRKFGANILQHPRGVTVDNKGRIVVVECKVMRVIIFDQTGNVLQKFGCSKHLEFPNGVVVNDKQEIFISDNRAHCVKVFSYEGVFLRQIGGEGITNYPIGVGINSTGEILIADNHNNFNLTIFTQDGQLVSALESKVKHAQCFDVALMDDGSVVLASKDYRLYIYRYVLVPPN
ncbi:brain tumor protein [Contarinia nasturtii]|uniref:brain tumor protein n=1 Tax=Contarinia nasturtii TaxID=265458 RepID=UPI0012D37996|nr:brain tumor protein [Contarinia nasturtii]XP_031618750.1 brain tumor protein [Contarinia nasturtii]